MTEFNLSEKIEMYDTTDEPPFFEEAIKSKDVKEFIRLLKEKVIDWCEEYENLNIEIDKLAGEKLI